MRKPKPPPSIDQVIRQRVERPDVDDIAEFFSRVTGVSVAGIRYFPWDELRRRPIPEGLSAEAWWVAVTLARNSQH